MADNQSELLDYQSLFNALSDGYIVFKADDPDFTVVAQNDVHEAMSFTKRKDTIGKPVLVAYPDTSKKYQETGVSDLIQSLRKVIDSGEPDIMPMLKYNLQDESGEWIEKYWSLEHHPVFDEKGQVIQVYQSTKDITNEVSTARQLAITEGQLSRAVAVGGIATWSWDLKENKIYGDSNLAYIFGLTGDEVKDGLELQVFADSIHPDDRELALSNIDKTLNEDAPFDMEYRTISRDGTVRWVMLRGGLEYDNDGQATNFPGALIDITDRRVAENNLRFIAQASTVLNSSLDYEDTLQQAAQLAVPEVADWCTVEIMDKKGVLQQVAVAHKEAEKADWARQLRLKQGPPDLSENHGVAQVIRTGEPILYSSIPDELLVASAGGDSEKLELLRGLGMSAAMVIPLTVEKKTVGALTMISAELKRHYTELDYEMAQEIGRRASAAIANSMEYDKSQKELAERKLLQKKLTAANDELESRVEMRTRDLERVNLNLQRSNRELENFAYVASHDLQEPLRKIQAFSNLLEDEYAEQLGDGADYLSRMRSAAVRMSALINDLLAFSRVATKKQPLVEVNLDETVKGVLSDLENLVARTNGVVEVSDLPTITADATQMRQLFQNLIANALKFHSPQRPPVVKVSATKLDSKKGGYEIRVSDNGVGFDEKYLDRIFAVFQRLNGRDEFEGTGIGLAVCRKIVERHGGNITAKSKIDKGSTFIVTLPHLKHIEGEEL